jgi:hypothetical protein
MSIVSALFFFHLYRPIPCGLTGNYAHYGLIEGLIGNSIGTLCKNNRFLLDNLVKRRRDMFWNSILNLGTRDSNFKLLSKFERMKERLLRFRQKKKAKFNAIAGNQVGRFKRITLGLYSYK